MKVRAVALVEMDSSGQLFVRPESDSEGIYEYIYREANGLRWNREKRALCAYEPERWQPEELFQHMVTTLRSAFDETLQLTQDTVWIGVPPELQTQLRRG
jgi:hypothetical protein